MKNVHERTLRAAVGDVGLLLDKLGSPQDRLWPSPAWPGMKFDRPLGLGARGGHGPIRYFVEGYEPGRSVRFRFTGPPGFDGWHGFEVQERPGTGCTLRHVLEMRISGRARLTWPLIYRPLHDALLEDSLASAQQALGESPAIVSWSPYVRVLRRALRRKRQPQ